MRKSVGTRAETVVNEHTNTCPPNLSDNKTWDLGQELIIFWQFFFLYERYHVDK